MEFEEVWREVRGLPDTAMLQVPCVLSESTKKSWGEHSLHDTNKIVLSVIDEVNHGSLKTLDELLSVRLQLHQ